MSKGKTTTVQEASLPAFQEAQFKELFGAAKGVAQQPFIPYTGPMVAGFSPDQLRQFQATRGLFETGMQFDPTKGLQTLAQEARPVTGAAPSLLGQDIGAYQSPYQQQVIDLAMQDLRKKRNSLLAQTDYLALSDQTMSAEMTIYRQALRDITNGLTTVADVEAVKFPERPEA